MENKVNENPQVQEQDVVIVGTKDADVLRAIAGMPDMANKHFVVLDEKVIDDYMKRAESLAKDPEQRLKDFLANTDNRNAAEEKALTLWNMMTKNTPLANSQKRIFTKSEVVNKTTLTNKQLGELLELWSLFGLIEYTKGTYEFKFVFGNETQAAAILADLSESVNQVIVDRERYIVALKACGKTDTEIDAEMLKVGGDIQRMLKI